MKIDVCYRCRYNNCEEVQIMYQLALVMLILSVLIVRWTYRDPEKKVLILHNPEVPQPPSPSKLYKYQKAAVCSDGAPCSTIGQNIMRDGGSAVDAAIAALFCNGIVNSHSMGLGGGFMMVIYDRKREKVESLIARETAPSAAHEDMFSNTSTDCENNYQPSRTGALAVGVPGELRGYWEAWKKHGKLKWNELVTPALKLCRDGYPLMKHQYDMLSFRKDAILNDPILRETFVDPKTKTYKRIGSIIRPVKLCDTLEIIANSGGDVLHNGTLTKTFVEDIKQHGGIITEDDLISYSPEWIEPVSVKLHGGETVYSVPPPGSGAILTLILSILDGYNITAQRNDSYKDDILMIHRMVEAFKFAYAKRMELGDPKFVNIKEFLDECTSKKFSMELLQRINDEKTFEDPRDYGTVHYTTDSDGTAHISIISPEGDGVSATSTINLYFGAGITSQRTGIILNSVMDDFSIPGQINYFGLLPSPNNFIAPNKRPMSSIAPTIVINSDGSIRLVIGASGGTKIPTALAWVILRHLWLGEDLKQAIDCSRIHHQLIPMEISYEYGILQQIIDGLENLGHKTSRYRERGSIICAVSNQNGKIYANTDFRKGGEVTGLN
ncbi:hypothetical protein O3M35_010743 [Rhynocoris fuscipes]|uniref:Uncharacterized protein n=1 Tax=Rhynocoris fuscipes TaxID=488301 RepID=A0AAW1D055_9HEMI